MREGKRFVLPVVAVACTLVAVGCNEDPVSECGVDAAISPGCGVLVGEAAVRLHDAREDLLTRIGSPDTAVDLANVGRHDTFETPGLAILYAVEAPHPAQGLIALGGFAGTTAEGLGIGSSRADVEAAYGAGVVDPFLGSAWYLDRGIGFEFAADAVTRIHVVPAEGGEG